MFYAGSFTQTRYDGDDDDDDDVSGDSDHDNDDADVDVDDVGSDDVDVDDDSEQHDGGGDGGCYVDDIELGYPKQPRHRPLWNRVPKPYSLGISVATVTSSLPKTCFDKTK